MLTLALILAGLAAAIHVYIFYLESVAWTRPATRATFSTTEEEAAATRGMAYNQGFYNLFLALVTIAGIVASAQGSGAVGAALLIAGCGSMAAAAVVLIISDKKYVPAALKQGTLPALALVALAVSAL
ncbi:DUF1304 domain-containing protein [Demequina litorisediminis]|uniref:Membrane protein n=1 Tax=Demequina litorisediminis TaxID=1849022 RepID=A0ABQ6IG10_9MICO|nr:DUF1304 domain-containing protein [Demequina litorisediminis]GMA36835.1 membrane protein [Demequina litorisediminis]